MQLLLLGALLAAPQPPAKLQAETTAQPAPRYAIETKLARKVVATMTWDKNAPNLKATEWVIFAPAAPNMPGRQVNVTSTLSLPNKVLSELSPLHQHVLRAQVPVKSDALKSKVHLQVTYKADLYSRNLMELPADAKAPVVAALDAKTHAHFLASTDLINFKDKAFQKWLEQHKLRKGASESEVDFARRAYLVITKGFTYEFKDSMDRHATVVCQAGKSDCGGLAIVFVSALRASGVPARLVAGRWAFSADPKCSDPYQYHVKAEFFVQGVGWVPADLSSGLNDKSPGGLTFFGHESGDFLVLHFDHGLVLNTVHFGHQTLTWLQLPAIWATGTGSFDNSSDTQDWQVKNVP
jgi:transglutaminase-like putative cysteine protease